VKFGMNIAPLEATTFSYLISCNQ